MTCTSTRSEELHTLGGLYESPLQEMRDTAGVAGEFYTPRPVVRFMVQVANPRLGESVLDPACGTGGFLIDGLWEREILRLTDLHCSDQPTNTAIWWRVLTPMA
jgi:hypothetical protein